MSGIIEEQSNLSLLKADTGKKLEKLSLQIKGKEPQTPQSSKKKDTSSLRKSASVSRLNIENEAPGSASKSLVKHFHNTIRGTPKSSSKGSERRINLVTDASSSSISTPSKSSLLTKQERDRQNAIYELIRTEQRFVELLEEIKKYYYDQLSDYLNEEEFKTIFSNFIEIYNVHKELAQNLLARQGQSEFVEEIGDIYLKYIDGHSQLRSHIEYSSNLSRMENEVNKLQSSQPFKDYLARIQEDKSLIFNLQFVLREDLSKPATHLTKCLVLIKSIVEATSNSHPDAKAIRRSLDLITGLLHEVNQSKREKEDWDKILSYLSSIDFSIDGEYIEPPNFIKDNDGKVFKEGSMDIVKIMPGLKIKKKRTITIVAIGTKLFMLEPTDKSYKKYRLLKTPIELKNVKTVDVEDMISVDKKDYKNLFEIRISDPECIYIFQAPSLPEKKSWMRFLGICDTYRIELNKQSDDRKSSASSSVISTTSDDTSRITTAPIKRRPSLRISEAVARIEGVAQENVENFPKLEWPLSDQQMGLASHEENIFRNYCLIKTLNGQEWQPIGPGDILLAKTKGTKKTRIVFFHKEYLFKPRVNNWLHPYTVLARHPNAPKSVLVTLPVSSNEIKKFSIQFKTIEESIFFYDLLTKLKEEIASNEKKEEVNVNVLNVIKTKLEENDEDEESNKPPIAKRDSIKIKKSESRRSSIASTKSHGSMVDIAGELKKEEVTNSFETSENKKEETVEEKKTEPISELDTIKKENTQLKLELERMTKEFEEEKKQFKKQLKRSNKKVEELEKENKSLSKKLKKEKEKKEEKKEDKEDDE